MMRFEQRVGFRLDEIAQLVTLEDGDHCNEAREQAELKLEDVRSKLVNLQRIETALVDLVDRCCAARGNVNCPLIATLQGLQQQGLASSGVPVNIRFEAATFNVRPAETMSETIIGFDIATGCLWPKVPILTDST